MIHLTVFVYFNKSGTWLGLSRLGKIGVLLNLDKNDYGMDESKKGRGNFVCWVVTLIKKKYI